MIDIFLIGNVKRAISICFSFFLPQDVVSLFHTLQHSGPEREAHLKALSKALRDPTAQLTFIKYGCKFSFKWCCSHLRLCSSCVMFVYEPVIPVGRRTACISWLDSSLALMLPAVCRPFGVFMSCLTLPTPTWHQPVCLPPPTCSRTCLARAPSSLWVSACTSLYYITIKILRLLITLLFLFSISQLVDCSIKGETFWPQLKYVQLTVIEE